jgi:hypothetical protein
MDNKPNLPKIIDCKCTSILGETIEGKLVPMSMMTQDAITNEIEELKNSLVNKKEKKIADFIKSLDSENNSIEDITDQYLKLKATKTLSDIGKEVNEEEIAKYIKKHGKLLIDGKTKEVLTKELATLAIDTEINLKVMQRLCVLSIFYSLRTNDNLKKRVYETIEELLEDISTQEMYNIFSLYNKENTLEEDDIKNSQSLTS